MSDDFVVKGLPELMKFFDDFPSKLKKNVLRGALRAGMKEVLPAAQSGVHSVSGELAKGLRIGTIVKGEKVIAYIRARGKHGFVARWVEFGTKAHPITAKLAGGRLYFAGRFAGVEIMHPGSTPKPFLRPALDQQAQSAVVASAEYMKKRLAKKQGLDTSDIEIAVSEEGA